MADKKPSVPSTPRSPTYTTFPPRKNDADCWNCVGVTYYSDFLRSQGKKPKCYGIEYVSGKQIKPEVMDYLEALPPIKKDTNVWIIGFAQSSLRMHRIGQPPLRRKGFHVLDYYDESSDIIKEGNRKKKVAESTKSTPQIDKPLAPPTPAKAPTSVITQSEPQRPPQAQTDSFSNPQKTDVPDGNKNKNSDLPNLDNTIKFLESYQRSASRLVSSMQKIYFKSTDDLPNRFEKSASKLSISCKKLAGKTVSGISNFIFGNDQDPSS